MPEPVDLELAFLAHDGEYCLIESRLSVPGENQLDEPQTARCPFSLVQLTELRTDPEAYGRRLTDLVFFDLSIRNHFLDARNESERLSGPTPESIVPLRLRVRIDKTAQALHRCLWETLNDPERNTPLSTTQSMYFSRFLARNDFRRIKLRRKDKLTALIAVSSPSDVGPGKRYSTVAPVDVAAEVSRARANLQNMSPAVFPEEIPLTFDNLIQRIASDPDILYLVCHGRLSENGEPLLYLEKENKETDFIKGSFFAQKLSEQPYRPRLVVLISCNSAGDGLPPATSDSGVLSILGPPIADCGVPAVIAMQGNVTMRTIERFMPIFFRELGKDGQLDRAMAVARSAVQENRLDFFSPVLFMRLTNGRLWYEPWAGMNESMQWPLLVTSIVTKKCTPILGSGLLDPLIGDTRTVASRLAAESHYPMTGDSGEDLPQVCQYIETTNDKATMQHAVRSEFARQLIRRFSATMPDLLRGMSLDDRLKQLDLGIEAPDIIEQTWQHFDTPLAPQAHRLLARIKFPRYITTTPDNLLQRALVAAGRSPVGWVYDRKSQSLPPELANYTQNDANPLLIHLFGSFESSDLLVWSEDNYFEYLMDVEKQRDLAKSEVTEAFTNSTLLFLGFHLQQWDFRVLLRSILALEGARHTARRGHVAVQVDPSEARTSVQRDQARAYLEKYFRNARITIFWGGVEDFLNELITRLQPGQLVSGR
jgi:hypothetical protein